MKLFSKSKWEECLQKIEHWTNNTLLLKTEVKDLGRGHADMRTVYTTHHSEIEQLKEKLRKVESEQSWAHEKIHYLEVLTARQQRTIIHRYESLMSKPKKRKEINQ